MAQTEARTPKPEKQRYRRTDEELIADLQKRIEDLKNRKVAKKLKASPASKKASNAYRALSKGIELCDGADDAELKRALSDWGTLLLFPMARYIEVLVNRDERRRMYWHIARLRALAFDTKVGDSSALLQRPDAQRRELSPPQSVKQIHGQDRPIPHSLELVADGGLKQLPRLLV